MSEIIILFLAFLLLKFARDSLATADERMMVLREVQFGLHSNRQLLFDRYKKVPFSNHLVHRFFGFNPAKLYGLSTRFFKDEDQ